MPTITYRTQQEMLEAFDRQQLAEARARAAKAEARLEAEASARKARRQREREDLARLEAEAVKAGCWAFTLPPWGEVPAEGTVTRDEPGWRVIARAGPSSDADRAAPRQAGVLPADTPPSKITGV